MCWDQILFLRWTGSCPAWPRPHKPAARWWRSPCPANYHCDYDGNFVVLQRWKLSSDDNLLLIARIFKVPRFSILRQAFGFCLVRQATKGRIGSKKRQLFQPGRARIAHVACRIGELYSNQQQIINLRKIARCDKRCRRQWKDLENVSWVKISCAYLGIPHHQVEFLSQKEKREFRWQQRCPACLLITGAG